MAADGNAARSTDDGNNAGNNDAGNYDAAGKFSAYDENNVG
jgi:hypothetical protein